VSDTNEFTDVDDNTQPSQLRQLLKQAHATIKQQAKQIEDFASEKAATVVKSTWDELQVPDAIRGFYNGDKTPDAMKQWWEASKGFFNIEAVEEQPADEQETDVQRATREAAESFQEATSLGSDALNDSFDAVTAKAKQAAKNLSGPELAAAKQEFYRATGLAEY
jgi:hypothetical protein